MLRSVTSRSTWARVLHLALGTWFAVACALVWPGLEDMSLRTLAGLYLAPLPVLAVLACIPAVRRSEGVQARALLLPGDDQVSVEPSPVRIPAPRRSSRLRRPTVGVGQRGQHR